MKILYFSSTDFYRKPNPSFHLMYAMISDILDRMDEVFYVGPAIQNVEKHIPDEFANNPNFHYRLVEIPPVAKGNFPLRYLKQVQYAFKARKFIKEYMPNCDLVFVQSSASILFYTLIASHYTKNQKVLINIQDMFPGSSIASGVMHRKWMQKIFYSLQKICYRKADMIVGISEDMRDKIMEQGVPYEKTCVVLNWFDDKSVHYVQWDENRFVKKYNMTKDKFYVQYAGTMGYVFDYKIVLEVAKRLNDYTDIEIQMIGMGSQKDIFVEKAKELGLSNIHFLPLEPQEMVSDVYSACSVCYIPLKHGIIGNSVPSKAGLLMECHKPIITSVDRGCKYAQEINENRIGIACSDDDPKSVVDAILYLYNNPAECREMGDRGYNYGHQLYSRSYNMEKYFEIFEALCIRDELIIDDSKI